MDSINNLMRLASEYGVYIGAIASLIFFFFEIFFDLGRTEKRGLGANLKSTFLLLSAAGTTTFAIISLRNEFEPKPAASIASERIAESYDACRARVFGGHVTQQQRAAMAGPVSMFAEDKQGEAITERLRLQCLAFAVQEVAVVEDAQPPSGSNDNAPTRLEYDVSLGERLLRGDNDDQETIAHVLKVMMGVYNDTFIGTGYTVPVSETDAESDYSDAALREYFAPNACAETINPQSCPRRSDTVWAFRFEDPEAVRQMRVSEVLNGSPRQGADSWARVQARINERDWRRAPILIRFQAMPAEYYVGTVGRPLAEQVFFSSVEDTIDLTLEDAFRLSGETDVFGDQGGNTDIFVWVYAPLNRNGYAMATWRNMLDLLRARPVDPALRDIARAERWPPRTQAGSD
jgi:hypothetical protein